MLAIVQLSVLRLSAQHYNFKIFDIGNQFDINTIQSLTSSEKGYLYLAGQESVYLFNGKSTEPLLPEYNIPFSRIDHLTEEAFHELYLLANKRLFLYGDDEPLLDLTVNDFVIDESYFILATDNGVIIWNKDQNILDRPEALEKISSFTVDDIQLWQDESLMISTNSGLFKYDLANQNLTTLDNGSALNLKRIIRGPADRLWGYDDKGSLYQIDPETRTIKEYQNNGFLFTSMTIDSSDRIWFGSANKGILRYDLNENIWRNIDQKSGLVDNRIIDMVTDVWGQVWIITADAKLSRFIDRDYKLYNVYDGLPSDNVQAIASGKEIFLSTDSKDVLRLNGREFEPVFNTSSEISSILINGDVLWMGTQGSGLINLRNGESTVFGSNAGLPSEWISDIALDSNNVLWAGTAENDLFSISNRDSLGMRIQSYGSEKGGSKEGISCLITHSSGRLIYGTKSGKIGLHSEGQWQILNPETKWSSITDIIENDKGEIIIGTAGEGVFKLVLDKQPMIRKLESYPSNVKALSYLNQELYAINNKGIFSERSSFPISEGFPSSNIKAGQALSFDSKIWIASADGLISVGKIDNSSSTISPKIFFERIQANYNPVPISRNAESGKTRISYNENQIGFEYEGVNIHSDKELSYSYFLEGRDKMWSPWTKNDNTSFNTLSPGSYVFKVQAKSDDNSISQPIQYAFTIEGPIWKKWWFLASLILGTALLVFLIFKQRIKVIKAKNFKEKEQLELKNRLLELEQKANQLQMNPHFIFNALNSIQATVVKENAEEARKEITAFATLMRSILTNSKERVITLEDELKLLDKYVEIEKKCREMDFTYKVTIDPKIEIEEVMIPPMLIQPFVENSIVHGLKSISSGKLILDLKLLKEDVLLVEIIDNGIGVDNSKSSKQRKGHKSVAIEVTKERLENMLSEGLFPVVEVVQVAESGGTKASLKIPIEYNY